MDPSEQLGFKDWSTSITSTSSIVELVNSKISPQLGIPILENKSMNYLWSLGMYFILKYSNIPNFVLTGK